LGSFQYYLAKPHGDFVSPFIRVGAALSRPSGRRHTSPLIERLPRLTSRNTALFYPNNPAINFFAESVKRAHPTTPLNPARRIGMPQRASPVAPEIDVLGMLAASAPMNEKAPLSGGLSGAGTHYHNVLLKGAGKNNSRALQRYELPDAPA
jgi:hypothetical protein